MVPAYKFIQQQAVIIGEEDNNLMEKIEERARLCFQSENNPKTNKRFVERLLENKHESVLEHFNISVRFITDRAMSHALVRHRHCAFTQESTHYIDYAKKKSEFTFIYPAELKQNEWVYFKQTIEKQMDSYLRFYKLKGKNAARTCLPMALKTELVVTTNIREWRHIFKLRLAFDHPQMVQLLGPLYLQFKEKMPVLFDNLLEEGEE